MLAVPGCNFKSEERTSDGRLVLKYWEKWTGVEKEAMQDIVDRYNESQNEVYVDFISMSNIDQKLLLATAGGNPPDIAGFWSHTIFAYAEKGAIYPLDSLMERDGISRDDYVSSVMDAATYRGFAWGIPVTPATVALHYNKQLFREAGLDPEDPPETLDEFDRVAKKLTKKDEDGNYTQMGFLPTDPGWWEPFWGFWWGAGLVNKEKTELLCDSPENIEAFKWRRGYVQDYDRQKVRLFEAAHRGQFASPSNSFLSGRVAMKVQGVWMARFIEEFNPDLEWGAAPLPAPESLTGGPATVVEADVLVIPRGAAHVEEAWDFIKFVQRQENIEELCRKQWKFSPKTRVSDDFYASHPHPYIRLFRELAESPNAKAVPKLPVWVEYRDELAVALERMWVNPKEDITVEEAMEYVLKRIQPKLDRANERWDAIGEQRMEEWNSL